MTPFTVDDLKRLKDMREELRIYPNEDLRSHYVSQLLIDIPALLARLEAAEDFAEGAALAFPSLKLGCDYPIWRKAAGK